MRDPSNIATVYYNCSQSTILDDFKDTNRKRIKRYECKGQLIVRINITSAHACVHMRHTSYHERPLECQVAPLAYNVGVNNKCTSEVISEKIVT